MITITVRIPTFITILIMALWRALAIPGTLTSILDITSQCSEIDIDFLYTDSIFLVIFDNFQAFPVILCCVSQGLVAFIYYNSKIMHLHYRYI